MNKDFWAEKNVFITGHTGFKGGWLSLWLSSLGSNVTGYSLEPDRSPNLYELAGVSKNTESVFGDVLDRAALSKQLRASAPEIVFHLAAQPLVRYSYDEPLLTFDTNVMGTANLLEACRNVSSVKAIVIITTDKCYENREWHWGYRESEPLGGYDPYSASKACAELVTSAYRRSFYSSKERVFIATARAGNVIGGGDWSVDRLIPDVLADFAQGKSVSIRSPNAIRPWQHVLEPLSGYLLLAERLCSNRADEFSCAWNFGPSEDGCQSVRWIVETMKNLWGKNATWEIDESSKVHEATYLKLDCSRARNLLGWEPRWTLPHALSICTEWHKSFLNGMDMREVAFNTIREYEDSKV